MWRCSCGQEWEENGDGLACSKAWKHSQAMARGGKKAEHKGIGLFDTETGELLVKSFNASLAIRGGYTRKREDSLYAKKKRQAQEEQSGVIPFVSATVASGSDDSAFEPAAPAKRKKAATPLRGKIPLIQVDIPAELWYLYILSMARFPGLDETAESFMDWLTYCIFKFHIIYADVFGLNTFLLEAAEGRGISVTRKGN